MTKIVEYDDIIRVEPVIYLNWRTTILSAAAVGCRQNPPRFLRDLTFGFGLGHMTQIVSVMTSEASVAP